MLFYNPAILLSQTEKVDLNMIYKIKQEGMRNSAIEELAFGLTDLRGPDLQDQQEAQGEMNGQRKRWKNLDSRM